jgi:macrolide transport system ATP-binding/permease protein
MENLLQDLRHAARALRRAPGFTVAAVLSLGLGIGANTAIYTVYHAALLEPLPVEQPERLVHLRTERGESFNNNFSYSHYVALRDAGVFAGLIGHTTSPLAVRFGNLTEQLEGAAVSPNYFSVLGVQPRLGRSFGAAQETAGTDAQVVLISDLLSERLFGGRENVVGEVMQVNGQPFTVIGVVDREFYGLTRGSREYFWIPMAALPVVNPEGARLLRAGENNLSWLNLIGRLKEGVSPEATQERLHALVPALREDKLLGKTDRNVIEPAARGFSWFVGELEQPLEFLMAAVGLVLLIACANVANLLLARAATRRKDLAIRLAIGGSRSRLLWQMLAEALSLALVAGAGGLLLASWMTDTLTAYRPSHGISLVLDTRPDANVLLFTLAISLLTGLVFGLGPALHAARADLMPLLKDASGRITARLGARSVLVVAQVALSLALVVGAGLMVRTLAQLGGIDLGYKTRNALLASFDLGAGNYDAARGRVAIDQLLQRIRQMPGVIDASAASTVTPSPNGSNWGVEGVEGYASRPDESVSFDLNIVDRRYFETLAHPLVQGRGFNAQDIAGATNVAIIDEEMARKYWPGRDPIGGTIVINRENNVRWQVIGVAKGSKYRGLRVTGETNVWRPINQQFRPLMTVIVHTRGEPLRLADAIRGELRSIDPSVPLFDVRTLDRHIATATSQERMAAQLATAFSVLALTLAAIGLYGLLAFFVTQRTREIGVRMALGAHRAVVLRHVMGRGLRLIAIGIVCGVPTAWFTSKLLSTLLFGVKPTDAVSFGAGAALLMLAGIVATLLPARRAVSVDPMVALRSE